MTWGEFAAFRDFLGKAGVCQYCGAKFEPDQTVIIVRDYEATWVQDWSAVCVSCASYEEIAAAKRRVSCKGCGQPMLAPYRRVPAVRVDHGGSFSLDPRPILASTCSRRCEQRYRRKLRRGRRDKIACAVCEKGFRPVRSDARFCSNACRQWAYRMALKSPSSIGQVAAPSNGTGVLQSPVTPRISAKRARASSRDLTA